MNLWIKLTDNKDIPVNVDLLLYNGYNLLIGFFDEAYLWHTITGDEPKVYPIIKHWYFPLNIVLGKSYSYQNLTIFLSTINLYTY